MRLRAKVLAFVGATLMSFMGFVAPSTAGAAESSFDENDWPPDNWCEGREAQFYSTYRVVNDTDEILVRKRMTQRERLVCAWNKTPPQIVLPGEELEFSVGIEHQGFEYSRPWWDESVVIYGFASDMSRGGVRLDANAGTYLDHRWSDWWYERRFIGDDSTCTVDGQRSEFGCSVTPSTELGGRTIFTISESPGAL